MPFHLLFDKIVMFFNIIIIFQQNVYLSYDICSHCVYFSIPVTHFGIALPKWIVEKQNSVWVCKMMCNFWGKK